MAAVKLPVLDLLLATKPPTWHGFCALFGDDDYLKHEARLAVLRHHGCQQSSDARMFAGRDIQWKDIAEGLGARSLFDSGPTVVVVEQADTFVTTHRGQLETWAAKPHDGCLLVVEVKTWNISTRLAKLSGEFGPAVDCGVPSKGAELGKFKRSAVKWLAHRARHAHGVSIDDAAIDTLFDLLPLSLGIIDQEIARLALVTQSQPITHKVVVDNVGGWRTRQTWDMIDAAADGRTAEAIGQLDRLIAAGEDPIALLAQVASTLRRYASAALAVEQAQLAKSRLPLSSALARAGIPPFKLKDAENQMKQVGRSRALKLSRWLVDADLAMKGHNSRQPASRLELERLLFRLSPQADSRRAVQPS
jgi:DNA polymerase-3 subunit delta